MSEVFKWLDRASKSNLPEVQAAAKVMKDYYEGATRDPQPQEEDHVKELINSLGAYRHCMSYNDSYFGEPPGFLKQTVRQLVYAVEPLDQSLLQRS